MAHSAYPQGGIRQHTLKDAIGCSGTGLHSGLRTSMRLCPGEPDSGIVFKRTDISGNGSAIPATWDNVVETRHSTTIGKDHVRVDTIEHLMAALSGCGIDNAVVEINGAEVPAMDGSAAPFVFLLECAGTVAQDAPRRAVEVLKPIAIGDSERTAALLPGNGSSVSFEIDFENTIVGRQEFHVDLVNGAFLSEISRARTFGFEHEVEQLKAAGRALGGSLENAIVVSDHGILNDEGLRYEDEFVRHKILDTIGDLYLAGGVILGHFHGYRSGHALNNQLLRTLFADADAWRLTTLEDRPHFVTRGGWSEEAAAASA